MAELEREWDYQDNLVWLVWAHNSCSNHTHYIIVAGIQDQDGDAEGDDPPLMP